jgi:hypothetical protein
MATATCGFTGGIGLTCEQLKESSGGLKQDVYLFNLSDLLSYTEDADGYVDALNFDVYKGMYVFTSTKNGASTISDIARVDGGNANFPQTLILSLVDVTPAQKETLTDLAYSTVVGVVETSKGRFEVFGIDLGLEVESAPKNSGNSPADATNRLVTLVGDQAGLEKVFFKTDYATTKALLESYVL